MDKKKVLLAFSGGLDTTFCAVYLAKKLNMEVHSAIVNKKQVLSSFGEF